MSCDSGQGQGQGGLSLSMRAWQTEMSLGDFWRRRGESHWTGLHVALDRTSGKVSTKVSHVLKETFGEGEWVRVRVRRRVGQREAD